VKGLGHADLLDRYVRQVSRPWAADNRYARRGPVRWRCRACSGLVTQFTPVVGRFAPPSYQHFLDNGARLYSHTVARQHLAATGDRRAICCCSPHAFLSDPGEVFCCLGRAIRASGNAVSRLLVFGAVAGVA